MLLGRLEEVDLRQLWRHEQSDFSKWLSQEENIELLNQALGFNLVDVKNEVFVGAYRCDLVASDETTGSKVIIENQLEQTNHDHLGKILTYASGLDASVIIWIVKEAREEHRSAIEWLNNKTEDGVSFFLLEIHAYRIGDSVPAPKFEIIEKPNDFIKVGNRSLTNGALTDTESQRLQFWTELHELVKKQNRPFTLSKPTIQHWSLVAMGTGEARISISLVNRKKEITVSIEIPDNKELFDSLYGEREEIENKLGFSMEWNRLDDKKVAVIICHLPGLNFSDHSNYSNLMQAVIEKTSLIRSVFKQYIS